jgi:hypothetical protein
MNSDLNELSSIIGELRNFAAQQSTTNNHMLEELRKISDRVSGVSEVGIILTEYRRTLHERFAKIHEQIGSIDLDVDRVQTRMAAMEMQNATWRSNWKLLTTMLLILSTLCAYILIEYERF